jgi:ribosomal protein S18 acetylase RimI-like enzyme
MNVRTLTPDDAPALIALRREALHREPRAFAASPDDDRGLSITFMRAALAREEEQAVFGCEESDILVGMIGLIRPPERKQSHKTRLWGLYVQAQHRRRGAGRALLDAAINHARSWHGVIQVHLSVATGALPALRLYESAGFRVWGREPRALHHEGDFVDESHLVLDLRGRASSASR